MTTSQSRFKVDLSFNVAHILTLITIIISVYTFYQSNKNNIASREKEQADEVRSAAVNTLAKLERWQDLRLSLYLEVQPDFVEASEMLFQDEATGVYKTRDFLWKALNNHRISIEAKILQEEIEIAYIELLSHFPASDRLFIDVFAELDTIVADNFDHFIEASQADIQSLDGQEEGYLSATLGNLLRATGDNYQAELEDQTNQALQRARDFLFDVIKMSDKGILSSSGRK
ncbi:MAG: hypothetical protein JXQ72_15245 [Anaerolineae bacterium]|nr:hypothetical protein [Anaerolineae bacterium]